MRFLATSSLLLATPLLAQQFPEVEPNDTVAAAQVVALGAQINCNLTAGEQDWFQFTTPGGYMRLATISALDLQMELSDATGTTVKAFTDDDMVEFYRKLTSKYPIVSIEYFEVSLR